MWFGLSGVWTRKVAVSLVQTADDGVAADWDVVIPQGFDDFWNTIDASGAELRITNAVGALFQYTVDNGSGGAFDKANRLGRIRLNDVANPAVKHVQLAWLFYGSTNPQGSGANGATGTGTKTGYIELARPGGPYVVAHTPQIPGTTQPLKSFSKGASEVADLWIRLTGARGPLTPYFSAPLLEGPHYFTQTVENTSGLDQPAMRDDALMRFVWGPGMGLWARVIVKAGSSGANYTSSVLTRMVSPIDGLSVVKSTLDTRIGWRVRDNRFTS